MTETDRLAWAREHLAALTRSTLERYQNGRRVLSFEEYLDLFASNPVRYGRDASRYLRDVFDHYGSEVIQKPWGQERRFRLFDLPWEAGNPRREALVSQERVQQEIYRSLCNFAREGRANRLILLHGPNGSAKSTVAACLMRALEHYSTLEEGALYRFHWVFPSQKTIRGSIGFGGEGERKAAAPVQSYAHLDETQIDARLQIEIRDHPLFLLPVPERRELLRRLWADVGAQEAPPEWLLKGHLNKKNQQVFEALLATYKGDLKEVLRHVQVERYFLSHRYRVGGVTIGPQMSVDAGEAQITADRSLAALPTALQATTLFEARGELIDAQGGLLEFSDLLKRPIDTFKYLQLSIETGEVSLNQQNVQLNCVMIGSANEVHLDAFREHHEFPSFRGRFELIRAPYLLSYLEEQQIYDNQILPQITRPTAPHATRVAAMFAVLTRMRKPAAERFEGPLGPLVTQLSALEKCELFATGAVPERLDAEAAKLLRAHIADLYHESDALSIYEGRVGASPREMRNVLLNAAQSSLYDYLSPLAVLEEIERLCTRKSEFAWLQEKPLPGGYHDVRSMIESIRNRLYDTWEEEFRVSTGLVDEAAYDELFERYFSHVSAWIKGEKLRNRITGDHENPDASLMTSVEKLLGVASNPEAFRRSLISGIAAWAIDHPGQKVDPAQVFPQHARKMRATVFAERRQAVASLCRDTVRLLRDGSSSGIDPARQEKIRALLARLQERFGYNEVMARDAASALVRWRFADLVV
jgi:serine protein kinase